MNDSEQCQANLGLPEEPKLVNKDKLTSAVMVMMRENPKELKTVLEALVILGKYGVVNLTAAQKKQVEQVRRMM